MLQASIRSSTKPLAASFGTDKGTGDPSTTTGSTPVHFP